MPPLTGHALTLIEDRDAAIQPFVDFDGGFGVTAAAQAGQKMDRVPIQARVLAFSTMRRSGATKRERR